MAAMLLKLASALLCLGYLCAQQGERKKRVSEEDVNAMFGKQADGGAEEPGLRLETILMNEAFDDEANEFKEEYRSKINRWSQANIKTLKEMQCAATGTKVFNTSEVTVATARDAAALLSNLMTSSLDSRTRTRPTDQTRYQAYMTLKGGLRIPPFVCWNSTRQAFQSMLAAFEPTHLVKVVHPKLMSLLTREVAQRLGEMITERVHNLLCDSLKTAETPSIEAVVGKFDCEDRLKNLSKADSSIKNILWQRKKRKQAGNMTKEEWDETLKDFGKNAPRDVIEDAPKEQIMERFTELYDESNRDLMLAKVNFTTVDKDFVDKLGDIACEIPTSRLQQIPSENLEGDSMSCLKKEKDKVKRRKMADKMLGTRDETKCKKYLEDTDASDEKCWKMMTADGLADLDFEAICESQTEELSCDTVREVLTDKLGLGKLSTWSKAEVKARQCLVRCLGPATMDSQDVDKMAEVMVDGDMPEDAQFPPALKRKLFKKVKETLGELDAPKLTKMRSLLSGMDTEEVKDLSAEVIKAVLPSLQKEFSEMSKPSRRRLVSKLSPSDLKETLCDMDAMTEDIPGERLMDVSGLVDTLKTTDCKFKCKNKNQCAALFAVLNATVDDWSEAGRDTLKLAQDTRAICGMTLDDIYNLQPGANFRDVAAAFFQADCRNPTMAEKFSDKMGLYIKFFEKRSVTTDDVDQLGPQYAKQMTATDLAEQDEEVKKSILRSLGQADLDDMAPKRVRDMAEASVTANVGESGDVTEAAVSSLGKLARGVSGAHVTRMTLAALMDTLPEIGEYPDVSEETLVAARQGIKDKMNVEYSTMGSDDVVQGGTTLLSDCEGVGTIPDETKSESLGDSAEAAARWQARREARAEVRHEPDAAVRARQDELQGAMRCGLEKMLQARPQTRAAAAASQGGAARKRRSTPAYTCADLRLLGSEALILSAADIAALSAADFKDCADVLGAVTGWTPAHKLALAEKAKQADAWGAVSGWAASDVLSTAGSIAQGLTAAELSSLDLGLQDIEPLGQHSGWTPEQMAAVFGKWLETDSSVSGGLSSATSGQLQQLGHFVCGATPTAFSVVGNQPFTDAMRDVAEAAAGHCSAAQLTAMADVALRALGSVTTWSLTHTAALGRVLAGLNSMELSLLSSSQLSMMDLGTFAAIPPSEFASLTVLQLQGLSSQQALSVTPQQLSALNGPQQAALADLGASIGDNSGNGVSGPTKSMGLLVALATAAMLMAKE